MRTPMRHEPRTANGSHTGKHTRGCMLGVAFCGSMEPSPGVSAPPCLGTPGGSAGGQRGVCRGVSRGLRTTSPKVLPRVSVASDVIGRGRQVD